MLKSVKTVDEVLERTEEGRSVLCGCAE